MSFLNLASAGKSRLGQGLLAYLKSTVSLAPPLLEKEDSFATDSAAFCEGNDLVTPNNLFNLLLARQESNVMLVITKLYRKMYSFLSVYHIVGHMIRSCGFQTLTFEM
jgi:hypothetical protein